MINKKFFWINIPIVYLLQFLDALSTNWALSIGLHEGNPIMEHVVQSFPLSLFVKFTIISLVMTTVYLSTHKMYFYWVLCCHQVMMIAVVINNFFHIWHKLNGNL